jgi:hypothetical protein
MEHRKQALALQSVTNCLDSATAKHMLSGRTVIGVKTVSIISSVEK